MYLFIINCGVDVLYQTEGSMLLVSYSVLQTVTYTLLARSASIIVKIMMIRMIMIATIAMIVIMMAMAT